MGKRCTQSCRPASSAASHLHCAHCPAQPLCKHAAQVPRSLAKRHALIQEPAEAATAAAAALKSWDMQQSRYTSEKGKPHPAAPTAAAARMIERQC
jgi:hypothetical protein